MLRRLHFLLWPACAVLLVAAFVLSIAQYYHPVYGFTALVQFDASDEAGLLPEVRERPAFINHVSGGYDGIYYAQLACRPLLRDPALPRAMEQNLAYRARRILTSWTAWGMALGDPVRALDCYAVLNPLCWLILAGVLLVIFPPRSAHDVLAWAGLLFSAGALASVRFALTDLPALLLLTGAMVAVQRGHLRGGTGLIAAASLTRETSLLALPILIRGPFRSNLIRLGLALVPLALWLAYIRIVVGPGDSGWGALNWPGVWFVDKWRSTLGGFARPEFVWLNWTTLLALFALTVQASWLLVRPQWSNLWWRFGLGYVGLLLVLGPIVWEGHPGAATRVLLPLNLAFNALAPRTRAGLALLILGNLTVPAGLMQLSSLPNDGIELAATRTATAEVLVQTRSGWFGVERHSHNFWAWSSGSAALVVKSRPSGATLELSFRLRSLAPRSVEISQDGHPLWRGTIGSQWQAVSLPCTDGTLEFHTDRPPVTEGGGSGGRPLAFCIDRVQIKSVVVGRGR